MKIWQVAKETLKKGGVIIIWCVDCGQSEKPSICFNNRKLMINLPLGSEYDPSSWKAKLLLKKIATPPLALVQQLNKVL